MVKHWTIEGHDGRAISVWRALSERLIVRLSSLRETAGLFHFQMIRSATMLALMRSVDPWEL